MGKKILITLVLVIVLAAVWYWLNGTQQTAAPVASPSAIPRISPVPEQTPQTLEQELDASLQGDIDAEFQVIDEDANSL